MPALPNSQQPDWSNNVYVVVTTRMFAMFSLAYLIKSLYNLIPASWGTRALSMAAIVADDVELQDNISDAPITPDAAGAAGTGPDLEANITLGLRRPQPSHAPPNRAARLRANARAESQGTEDSRSATPTAAMPEQDVGVRSGLPQIEEHMHTAVGHSG